MKTVFLLDNKDSFTYNILHYLEGCNVHVVVARSDEPTENWPSNPDAVVLSPGPGIPKESGSLLHAIAHFGAAVPVLGVCLGHQALVESFGGQLYSMRRVDHGVSRQISVDNSDPLFQELPQSIEVGLYHSWAVVNDNLDEIWKVIAHSGDVVMGIKHKELPIWGVQFHPESVMTPEGKKLISNFINFIQKNSDDSIEQQ